MERYSELERLFARIGEVPEREREVWLRQQCAGRPELMERALALLAHYHETEEWTALDSAVRESSGGATASGGSDGFPEFVGPYRVLEELGRGGMGRVLLAEREGLGKRVALKVISSPFAGADAQRRFDEEQHILARMEHPGIGALVDAGVTKQGLSWFAMELVQGLPITRYARERTLGVEGRVRLILELCAAVEYAHSNLVVHRDIKPSNVLVTGDGRLKLLDFGVAKLLDVSETQSKGAHTRVFTPSYASPEQVRGDRITAATDIYQVGALLYELLCGVTPFDVDTLTPAEAAQRITDEEPRPPSENPRAGERGREDDLRRRARGDLDRIVLKCLEKEPDRRYASIAALADDLRRYLEGRPVLARPGGLGYRSLKFVRRNRTMVAALVLGVAYLGTLAAQNRRVAAERDRATESAAVAQRESARLRTVTDFIVGLFQASDPEVAPDPQVSALELLRRGAERVDSLSDDPATQATVLLAIAQSMHNLQISADAEVLLRRVLALAERSDMELPQGARLSDLRLALAQNLSLQNRFEESAALYRRLADPDAESVDRGTALQALEGLASVLHMEGKPQAADSAQQRWEALLVSTPDLSDRETVRQLGLLGRTYLFRGEIRNDHAALERARDLLTRSVSAYRSLVPASSPEFRGVLANLTRLALDLDDTVAADSLSAEGLRLVREDYDATGDLLSWPLTLRGLSLEQQGRYQEAEPLFREAVAREFEAQGESMAWATRGDEYAGFLRRRGRFDEAVAVLEGMLPFNQRQFGADHVMTLTAQAQIGVTLGEAGRYAEAEGYLLEAYQKLAADRPLTDGMVQLQLRHLCRLYRLWERTEDAGRCEAKMTADTRAGYDPEPRPGR
ncbi:MAG: serine/threonine-protein kinase [Gemmatimonadota bacterium]